MQNNSESMVKIKFNSVFIEFMRTKKLKYYIYQSVLRTDSKIQGNKQTLLADSTNSIGVLKSYLTEAVQEEQ